HRRQCNVSKEWGKERSSWSGRSGSVLACGFSGPCHQPRPAPEPDPGWRRGTSCCCVAAVQGPGTMGSGFRIYLPDLGGAKGIRTPDLLHAMQLKGVAGCG